jgi:hypothetical protein
MRARALLIEQHCWLQLAPHNLCFKLQPTPDLPYACGVYQMIRGCACVCVCKRECICLADTSVVEHKPLVVACTEECGHVMEPIVADHPFELIGAQLICVEHLGGGWRGKGRAMISLSTFAPSMTCKLKGRTAVAHNIRYSHHTGPWYRRSAGSTSTSASSRHRAL